MKNNVQASDSFLRRKLEISHKVDEEDERYRNEMEKYIIIPFCWSFVLFSVLEVNK